MMSFHLSGADYVVVIGYFLVVLAVGFYFRNRVGEASDYFAGGHQIPWWLAGISHYMSSFSAFSFIAYAQMGYSYGFVAITLFAATVPACLLGAFVFARRWRRARIITPVQFLEARFNPFVRQLFAWAGIPMKVFDDALKIFSTGIFVALGTSINLKWAIVTCGAVMVVYTFLGGLWALVVTDYVQFLMKALAMLMLLPMAVRAAGGLSTAFHGLPPHFFAVSSGPYGWSYIVGWLILVGISYNSTWALAQKYYSVRNEKEASKTALCAAVLNVVGAPVMILPAVLGRKFLPDLLVSHRTADVYVLLILKLLPVGMVGIIVAAMLAATMATVSADFNAMASVLTKDFYQRVVNPTVSESRLVRVGRFVTLGLGGLTVFLSLWIAVSHHESLFHLMVTVFGLFMAPTFLPVLAGLTIRRLTWKGAIAGFATGLATGASMLAIKTWFLPHATGVSPEWADYHFEGISILVNVMSTVLAMLLATRWLPTTEADTKSIGEFFRQLDRPIGKAEGGVRSAAATAAISLSTVAVGGLLVITALFCGSKTAALIDVVVGLGLAIPGMILFRRSNR